MTCYILDDQFGTSIYEGLSVSLPDWSFPIQKNILNPLDELDNIIENQPDYILLDNYFPNRGVGRDEALGNEFLEKLLEHNISSKIICISDYGERLLDQYDAWQQCYEQGKILSFISTKNPNDLKKSLLHY